MLHSKDSLPARDIARSARKSRAFTLLEVALVVAIIGMMLLMIVGYLFAPNKPDKLPPVAAPTPIPPSSDYVTPAPRKAAPIQRPATPALATPAPAAAAPAAPAAAATPTAPATPAATPVPTQTIDLSPQSVPIFR